MDASRSNLLAINPKSLVVYRITALAYGRKSGTLVALQQTYAQQRTLN
jgi:type IV pilus assembly protein PilX